MSRRSIHKSLSIDYLTKSAYVLDKYNEIEYIRANLSGEQIC